jgi:hypothetical protein
VLRGPASAAGPRDEGQFTNTSGSPVTLVSVSGAKTTENVIAGTVAVADGHRLLDPVCKPLTAWSLKVSSDPVFDALPLICVVE